MKKLKFYTLLYIDPEEKRQLAGRIYTQEERVDVFVHNACVLDRTLQLCCGEQGVGGCTILTNDVACINASLTCVKNSGGGKIYPLHY